MIETIGKVTIDTSAYEESETDLFAVPDRNIMHIARDLSKVEYAAKVEELASYPVLYQYSPLRENVVDFLPIHKNHKVLEIGSGCGAITGALARKAAKVTCVEASKQKSLVNAHRHSDCDNIAIHVGEWEQIEKNLEADYDFICLIDVFEEYELCESFLSALQKHLADGGRIVMALPNKYGMKFFAGARNAASEDYFTNIEAPRRGFSRNGLLKLFAKCGVQDVAFYYPYPDYRFATAIYSDVYKPGKGELSNNLQNFEGDRMLLFDEKAAFDGVIEDGLFGTFANSFVAVIGGGFDVKFAKYSNDRAPQYQIKTTIVKETSGEVYVCKHPITQEAAEHVRGMQTAYESLLDRYEGGSLSINRCELVEEDGEVYAKFDFVQGTPLSELMDDCIARQDMEGFHKLFDEYLERVGYNEEYPVSDFDLIFANVLVNGEEWTLIDYEWTFGKAVPMKELAFRAIYCYLLEDEKRNCIDLERVLDRLEITQKDAENYREQEMDFQKFVTGKRKAMCELRDMIGGEIYEPRKWLHKIKLSNDVSRVQIYEDMGKGFSEELSYFVEDAFVSEQTAEFTIGVNGNVKQLRIDPYMDSCIVKITEMTFNGLEVPLSNRKIWAANGKVMKGTDADTGRYQPSIVFATKDPNISIDVTALNPAGENVLTVRMEVVRLPMAMAEDMAGAVKKIF